MKAQAVEPASAKPVAKTQTVDPDTNMPIKRAEPVDPGVNSSIPRSQQVEAPPEPKEIRRAKPVRPADEIPDDQILRSTPPPASDFGD